MLAKEKILRIGVRTGYRGENGVLTFAKQKKDKGRQDHYAVVVLNEVTYIPELPPSEIQVTCAQLETFLR